MKRTSADARHHKRHRDQAIAPKESQKSEPWNLRAIKLQLLYPEVFEHILTLSMSTPRSRMDAEEYFVFWAGERVLDPVGFENITMYRIGLFIKAVREQARVKHQAQDSATPSPP